MNPEKKLLAHEITIINRQNVRISGVEEVVSADSTQVVLDTACGRLIIKGDSISMGKLDTSSGELDFSGKVTSLDYKTNKGSGFARLFR